MESDLPASVPPRPARLPCRSRCGEAAVGVGVDVAADLLGEVEDVGGEVRRSSQRYGRTMLASKMLLRMSRLASRICKAALVPLMVKPTMTRLSSLLGGMGRLAKVYCGNL